MKILRIIPSMNPKHGGPSQGIRNSIPAMKELGVDNDVVCFDSPSEEFIKSSSFNIIALGNSKSGWAYNGDFEDWLTKHLCNYDVVIIHGLWLYHSYASVKVYLKLAKYKTVPKIYAMAHGMLDPWFQRDKSRRLKAIRNEIYWRLIEKKVVNNVDGLLFTCEQELLLARETFSGYRPKKELNVGYGIQAPPSFTEDMFPVLKDKPYWLFLSRIHPKKGVDILIQAYQEIRKKYKNVPDLVVAGPTESEYAQQMITMAAGDEKIHFPGLLQGDVKWGAFYGAELFILPSHQENFGIAVVEALACGVPVLISDQVNIWREIVAEEAGLVGTDTYDGVLGLMQRWIEGERVERSKARAAYALKYKVESAANQMLLRIQ
jgi:glycosyltransferase involved in cell wall biosynthesis